MTLGGKLFIWEIRILKKNVVINLVTKRKEIDEETVEVLDQIFGEVGSDRDIKIPDYEGDLSQEEYNSAVKKLLEYIFGDEDKDELDSLYDDIEGENYLELMSEGELEVDKSGEVTLSYLEGDENGLEGTKVKLVFNKEDPLLISMLREGQMNTMLSFEAGKRHKSIYHTPYMPFDLTVNTIEVENNILDGGMLYLNYIMEVHGLCRDRITIAI